MTLRGAIPRTCSRWVMPPRQEVQGASVGTTGDANPALWPLPQTETGRRVVAEGDDG